MLSHARVLVDVLKDNKKKYGLFLGSKSIDNQKDQDPKSERCPKQEGGYKRTWVGKRENSLKVKNT